MTLDEAIKHCEEVAELNEECTRIYNEQGETMASYSCNECAKEHRQLAEWMKELKEYRERIPSYEAGYNDAKREIALSGEYKIAYQRGYEKAMEYCTKKLEEVNKQMEVNADE